MITLNEGKWSMLQHWMREREDIHKLKELGTPKPWTDDPILQQYRFCNVHRMDDKVSQWIYNNWIFPHLSHPNLTLALAMARLVNWPDTLEAIGFPLNWNKLTREHYISTMERLMRGGKKVWTGAYMITAEYDGTPKHESVAKTLDVIATLDPGAFTTTLYDAWIELQTAPRVGGFIAAQIVGDLKYGEGLMGAKDWSTFCSPGPGSVRGLNWLHDLPTEKYWGQAKFEAKVNELRTLSNDENDVDLNVSAQDFQNCLCEIFKYQRGSSRSKYNGVK